MKTNDTAAALPNVKTRTIDLARFKDAIGLAAAFNTGWTITRKARLDKIKLDPLDPKRDEKLKKYHKLGKQLIISPEYDAITKYFGRIQRWLNNPIDGKTVPGILGLRLCARDSVGGIQERLERAIGERPQISEDGKPVPELPQLRKAFLKVYPDQVKEARSLLEPEGQFNLNDYPSEAWLEKSIDIFWNWIAFTVPESLPPELRQLELDKFSNQLTDAGQEIIDALRESFQKLITHAADSLQTKPGEKRRIFDTTLENIQGFIDTFNARNILNDADLALLVAEARTVLESGVTTEKLRSYESVRDTTAKKFSEIADKLSGLVTIKPSRVISLDDDEAPTPETPAAAQEAPPAAPTVNGEAPTTTDPAQFALEMA